jgi:hypothetical protein
MAIHIRNRPSDADRYRVVDLKITGASYDALTNRTTLTIDPTDTKHDSVEPGYFMIPQRNHNTPTQIVHPLKSLKVVGTTKTSTSRTLVIEGNQIQKLVQVSSNLTHQH